MNLPSLVLQNENALVFDLEVTQNEVTASGSLIVKLPVIPPSDRLEFNEHAYVASYKLSDTGGTDSVSTEGQVITLIGNTIDDAVVTINGLLSKSKLH